MRIAQVSAHYPPNFVSGGTLVPQRVARYVAEAGHESFVFAGYLDDGRQPLETWDEDDGQGVHVTWVVTTPWTAWTDPLNFDNPAVTEVFEAWLDRVQPDVVHVHSLQTLGVGLIEAAHERGARVIVTMHDFWWFCSRQFLVDESMVPCSLVVDCGTCGCASGRSSSRRAARLREALRSVDLVLAPSEAARQVFAANGVDPDRLLVNENGLPDDQLTRLGTTPRRRRGSGPLRIMYAGGTQPMKGFEVLCESARTLGDRPGIEVDAYGVGERSVPGTPRWFRPLPPYSPDDLLSVLDEHDVLVLPSVMRESHSILTREALAAGLAVICTDTLGPEAVVRDGVNGHVVPAGDAAALAEVLGRLADDPAASRRLTGQGPASPIRAFTDQAEQLVTIYSQADDGARAATAVPEDVYRAQARLLREVLFIVGIDGAPLRYRVHLPAEALAGLGHRSLIRHYRDPRLVEEVRDADAIVLYRVPATDQVLQVVDAAKERRVPVLYDVDDLIFDPALRGTLPGLSRLAPEEEALWWHGVDRYRTTLEACDGFIGSTAELCAQATRLSGLPAYRFSNGVGRILAQASDQAVRDVPSAAADGSVSIGYFSGTDTHDADWAVLEPAILAVMRRHPEVRLRLGGHLAETSALAAMTDRVDRQPFVPWQRLPRLLRETDVNLAPLAGETVFNESKSAIKWLEAALVSRPTIASPTTPFTEAIEHGRTGFLASTTDEWERCLEALVSSRSLRAQVGAAARRKALLTWSPALQGRVYEELLVRAALDVRVHGHREASRWTPVADSEPFSVVDAVVDPYLPLPEDRGRMLRGERARRLARLTRRTRTVIRHEGVRGVATRARRRLKG